MAEATQAPARQASPVEQALPSSQAVPSGFATVTHAPVVGLHVPARWQESAAGGQTTGVPATQDPLWQTSPLVQELLSLQATPFGAAGFEQVPSVGLQAPAWWHWSEAAQTLGEPPVQAPAWQVSTVVQALPSLQVVPFAAVGFEHAPVLLLQVPGVWQTSGALQRTGVPMVQMPPTQMSLWVHALLSLQVTPSGEFGFEQTPVAGAQTPATWHWSKAAQVFAGPGTQAPATQ